jgi:hypothetical protein
MLVRASPGIYIFGRDIRPVRVVWSVYVVVIKIVLNDQDAGSRLAYHDAPSQLVSVVLYCG